MALKSAKKRRFWGIDINVFTTLLATFKDTALFFVCKRTMSEMKSCISGILNVQPRSKLWLLYFSQGCPSQVFCKSMWAIRRVSVEGNIGISAPFFNISISAIGKHFQCRYIWNPLIWKYRRIFCKRLFWWDTHTDTLDRFYILGCWHRREWLVPRIDLISFNKSTIPRKLDSLFQNCNCFNINQIIKKAKRNKFLS